MVISFDLEVAPKEIWSPSVYVVEDGHHLFFIGRLAQIYITQLLTSEGEEHSFLF